MKLRKWPLLVGTSVLFLSAPGCDEPVEEASNGAGNSQSTLADTDDSSATNSQDANVLPTEDASAEKPDTTGSDTALAEDGTTAPEDAQATPDAVEDGSVGVEDTMVTDTTLVDADDSSDTAIADTSIEETDVQALPDVTEVDVWEDDAIGTLDVQEVDAQVSPVLGACCTSDFNCIDTTEDKCPKDAYDFAEGLSCAEDWPCPVPGFVGIAVAGKSRTIQRSLRRA